MHFYAIMLARNTATNERSDVLVASHVLSLPVSRLPHDMSQTIMARQAQQAERATKDARRTSQSTTSLSSTGTTKQHNKLHHLSSTLHRPPSTPSLNQGYQATADTEQFRPSSADIFDRSDDMEEPDYRCGVCICDTLINRYLL